MTNAKSNGNVLNYVNLGADIASGAPVVLGKRIGIAVTAIAAAATGAVNLNGAYELASAGFDGDQGQRVYWDSVAKEVTEITNANCVNAGILFVACAAGDSTCIVVLEDGSMAGVAANVAVIAPSNYTAITGVYADLPAARTSVAAFAAEVETRDDAQDTKINAILTALQAAGIMLKP